jgi:uncharacterized protein
MTGGAVAQLCRYPVKSMLGEDLPSALLTEAGVAGDRVLALIDEATGHVATAKHPRLWRQLLGYRAAQERGSVRIVLPDGRSVDSTDSAVDEILSVAVGRPVHLASTRPDGATVERPDPEDVLANGVGADVAFALLEIAQGATGGTFVDHSPVHLVSAATLHHIGAEWVRYRPNLVVDTDTAPFAENAWVGREIAVGPVVLRGTLPTPRCSVPTLAHGDLPPAPHAVRNVIRENRVEVRGFGVLPCAGIYAEVVVGGTVRPGDSVRIG